MGTRDQREEEGEAKRCTFAFHPRLQGVDQVHEAALSFWGLVGFGCWFGSTHHGHGRQATGMKVQPGTQPIHPPPCAATEKRCPTSIQDVDIRPQSRLNFCPNDKICEPVVGRLTRLFRSIEAAEHLLQRCLGGLSAAQLRIGSEGAQMSDVRAPDMQWKETNPGFL